MNRFRKSEFNELEGELRKGRPEPRSEFVSALASDVRDHARRPATGRRMALAGVLTAAMLTTFASFGGVGYATSAVKSLDVARVGSLVGVNSKPTKPRAAKAAQKKTVRKSSTQSSSRSFLANNNNQQGPDDDQYKPGKGCGDKNHVHLRQNECK